MEQSHWIRVGNPILENADWQFVTYLLTGKNQHGSFEVRRRYREFDLLRAKLVEQFIGFYVPPIGSKKMTGNVEDKFVEERLRQLERFCSECFKRVYILNSSIFNQFVRQVDFQGSAKSQQKAPNYQQILQAVLAHEQQQDAEDIEEVQMIKQNEADYDFMKKAEKKLLVLREEFIMAAENKRNFLSQYLFCTTTVIPSYQKMFIHSHDLHKELQMLDHDQHELDASIGELRKYAESDPWDDYVQMVSEDIREMKAFMEALDEQKAAEDRKNKYEASRHELKEEHDKLTGGKTTLRSIFTSGNKQAQAKELESLIGQFEKNEEALAKLVKVGRKSLHREIRGFKQRRRVDFVSVLREASKKEMNMMTYFAQLLKLPLSRLQSVGQ